VEPKPTVLVVDDEPDLLHTLAAALLDEGYAVWQATNGREALDLALLSPPDAVISNISMPQLDGIQLAAALKQRGMDIPVILMSANNELPGLPGVAFVSKPFQLDHLLAVVERTLGLA
jgi:CheY-like chemotaxis protein